MTFINYLKGYKIEYSRSALKKLNKLETFVVKAIEAGLNDLVDGKNNLDVIPLQGYSEPTSRLRIGYMRIIFSVDKRK